MAFDRVHTNRVLVSLVSLMMVFGICREAVAWTQARLISTDVTLQMASQGESRFSTEVTFEVQGGRFHGFDLAPMDDMTLVEEESWAQLASGKKYSVTFKTLFDDRTRVMLADKQNVGRCRIVFHLVHTTDLAATGALRLHHRKARLEWTPIIWDHGMDSMSVTVIAPRGGEDRLRYDMEVNKHYDIAKVDDRTIRFVKHRAPKWYPMQVALEMDLAIVTVPRSASSTQRDHAPVVAVTPETPRPGTADSDGTAKWLPLLVLLAGLVLLMAKARFVLAIHGELDVSTRFVFLRHTTWGGRLWISLAAIAAAVGIQSMGIVAASVPLVGIAVVLWLVQPQQGQRVPRSGGEWRHLEADELADYRTLYSVYKRRRFSFLDISSIGGMVAFAVAMGGLIGGSMYVLAPHPQQLLATIVNGFLPAVATWFVTPLRWLPCNPSLETFKILKYWRQAMNATVGTVLSRDRCEFWIREDLMGPIEIRARCICDDNCHNMLEICYEVVHCVRGHKIRPVAVVKTLPSSEAAKALATCSHASHHYITQNRDQEVFVLRSRRGKKEFNPAPLEPLHLS